MNETADISKSNSFIFWRGFLVLFDFTSAATFWTPKCMEFNLEFCAFSMQIILESYLSKAPFHQKSIDWRSGWVIHIHAWEKTTDRGGKANWVLGYLLCVTVL